MNIPDKLRKVFERSTMSGHDLAKAADLPRTTIQRFIQNDGGITHERLCKIAKALGYKITVVKR
jgi:plasmid maintenance system antidote protein VapI